MQIQLHQTHTFPSDQGSNWLNLMTVMKLDELVCGWRQVKRRLPKSVYLTEFVEHWTPEQVVSHLTRAYILGIQIQLWCVQIHMVTWPNSCEQLIMRFMVERSIYAGEAIKVAALVTLWQTMLMMRSWEEHLPSSHGCRGHLLWPGRS